MRGAVLSSARRRRQRLPADEPQLGHRSAAQPGSRFQPIGVKWFPRRRRRVAATDRERGRAVDTKGNGRVVILGGGFAGVGAAQKLEKAKAEVVLVDRHDYHTFQPLLY